MRMRKQCVPGALSPPTLHLGMRLMSRLPTYVLPTYVLPTYTYCILVNIKLEQSLD